MGWVSSPCAMPCRTHAWRARTTVWGLTDKAAAATTSESAGPCGPWSTRSQIWARWRVKALRAPVFTSRARAWRWSSDNSTV